MKNNSGHEFQHLEWIFFVHNYLSISQLACLEMLEHKNSKCNGTSDSKIVNFDISNLYIAVIYNIKHAIEIAIKTFNGAVVGCSGENHHNVKEFIAILKSKINSSMIKRKVKKLTDKKILSLFKKLEKNFGEFDTLLDTFEKLVIKYYNCNFIKDKISTFFEIEDKSNTAFRYPTNDILIKLDYQKIINNINNKDVEEIKKDIAELYEVFNVLELVMLLFKLDESRRDLQDSCDPSLSPSPSPTLQ